MDYIDLLVRRRSIRDFQESPLPHDTVVGLVREACLAPSAGNGQPWQFIIIHNRELIKKLSDESKKNLLASLRQNPASSLKAYEATLRNASFNVFYNAPCLVYIGFQKDQRSGNVDCALAAAYLMFSAAALKLGSCWIALGADIRDPEIRGQVGMPEDYQIVAPIILGHPKEVPAAPTRAEPRILRVIP